MWARSISSASIVPITARAAYGGAVGAVAGLEEPPKPGRSIACTV